MISRRKLLVAIAGAFTPAIAGTKNAQSERLAEDYLLDNKIRSHLLIKYQIDDFVEIGTTSLECIAYHTFLDAFKNNDVTKLDVILFIRDRQISEVTRAAHHFSNGTNQRDSAQKFIEDTIDQANVIVRNSPQLLSIIQKNGKGPYEVGCAIS